MHGWRPINSSQDERSKKAKIHEVTLPKRLEGLVPVADDWHTKMRILGVFWKNFYSINSSADHGTLFQLRNKLNRTNVVNNPQNNFNACDDFFILVVTGHIIAAALKVLKMTSTNEVPSEIVIPA